MVDPEEVGPASVLRVGLQRHREVRMLVGGLALPLPHGLFSDGQGKLHHNVLKEGVGKDAIQRPLQVKQVRGIARLLIRQLQLGSIRRCMPLLCGFCSTSPPTTTATTRDHPSEQCGTTMEDNGKPVPGTLVNGSWNHHMQEFENRYQSLFIHLVAKTKKQGPRAAQELGRLPSSYDGQFRHRAA